MKIKKKVKQNSNLHTDKLHTCLKQDLCVTPYDLLSFFKNEQKYSNLNIIFLRAAAFTSCVIVIDVVPVLKRILLLELSGRDKAGPQVAVTHAFGLPPCGVVLTDHLQDVTPQKGKSCLLARRGLVVEWRVVKQGPQIHLAQESEDMSVSDVSGIVTLSKDSFELHLLFGPLTLLAFFLTVSC